MPYCLKCNSPEVVLADIRLLKAGGSPRSANAATPVTGAVKVFRCTSKRGFPPLPCGATWEVVVGTGNQELREQPST